MGIDQVVYYILAINTIVSIIILLFNIILKRKNSVIKAVISLFCPVVGPIFLVLSYIVQHIFFSKPVDLDDVIFSKDRVKSFVRPDEVQEANMVPLEEAIEITDSKDLRNLMMNVVKGDATKMLSAISLALNSSDSETSHYAASVLQEELSRFRDNVRKHSNEIRENKINEKSYVESFVQYMNEILLQNVFTSIEQKGFVKVMDEMCEILYEESQSNVTSEIMEDVTLRLIEANELELADKWINRAKSHYPDALSTYNVQMKLYFTTGNKEKFFETVKALKGSAVVVDNDTLERIRVFE